MSLQVKIPKKYEESLRKRFFLAKKLPESILASCKLCKDFRSKYCRDAGWDCGGCPFAKFKSKERVGCSQWITKVLGREFLFGIIESYITLGTSGSEVDYRELVKKAEKLVTFIK